jgi:hypothetical protein
MWLFWFQSAASSALEVPPVRWTQSEQGMHRALLLVLLVLCVPHARGQIRTGWGITPPCKVVKDGISDLIKINFLDNCDMWHAPHIANPFILTVFTNRPFLAFFVSCLFEIFEGLMVVVFKNFALFAGAANSLENIPDIILDDEFIQAGLGVLLGAFYMWFTQREGLWGNWWTDRRSWLWWLFWYTAIMVTQTTYGLNLNDDDPTGFPIGGVICCAAMGVVFAFLVQNEPDWRSVWKGRTHRSRAEFWGGAITVYFSFYLVVMFDFFFSSAAQTWVLWLVWVLGFILCLYIRGKGGDLMDLLNWQVNYVRSLPGRLPSLPRP